MPLEAIRKGLESLACSVHESRGREDDPRKQFIADTGIWDARKKLGRRAPRASTSLSSRATSTSGRVSCSPTTRRTTASRIGVSRSSSPPLTCLPTTSTPTRS